MATADGFQDPQIYYCSKPSCEPLVFNVAAEQMAPTNEQQRLEEEVRAGSFAFSGRLPPLGLWGGWPRGPA